MDGDSSKIACNYKGLPQTVSIGSNIYIGEGAVRCEVVEVSEVSPLRSNNKTHLLFEIL